MPENAFSMQKIENSIDFTMQTELTLKPIATAIVEVEEEVIVPDIVVCGELSASHTYEVLPTVTVFSSQFDEIGEVGDVSEMAHVQATRFTEALAFDYTDEILLPYATYDGVELINPTYKFIFGPDSATYSGWKTAGEVISDDPPSYVDSVTIDHDNQVLRMTLNSGVLAIPAEEITSDILSQCIVLVYADNIKNPNNPNFPEFDNAAVFGVSFVNGGYAGGRSHRIWDYTVFALSYDSGTGEHTHDFPLPYVYEYDSSWISGDSWDEEAEIVSDREIYRIYSYSPSYGQVFMEPYNFEDYMEIQFGLALTLGAIDLEIGIIVNTGSLDLSASGGEYSYGLTYRTLFRSRSGNFYSEFPVKCAFHIRLT